MPTRTTLEIDRELLERAKRVLGTSTMRETVDLALRRITNQEEAAQVHHAERQRDSLRRLADHIDLDVLASEEMWR